MSETGLADRILHRDADVLIIDKPAGIAVHAAPGVTHSLEAELPDLRFGLKWVPGLTHRLDRETSGCLVLGRHPQALRTLNRLFAEGAVEKTYWAIVEPGPDADAGEVDLPLLKVHRGRHWHGIVDPAGQAARTGWRVLGRAGGRAWLELTPETGRTHQLRIHCASQGWPILGDRLYGAPARTEPLHLHARAVRFRLNPKRPAIEAVAMPPAAVVDAFSACGFGNSQPR